MFKKGDYIVLVEGEFSPKFKYNHCYLQRRDCGYIQPEFDSIGSSTNGWIAHPFDKSKGNNWRYATEREIEEYKKLNFPIDLNMIKKSKFGFKIN